MIKRKTPKKYFFSLLIIFLLAIAIFFVELRSRAFETKPTSTTVTETKKVPNQETLQAASPKTNNPAASSIDFKALSITVLMYHHVRDYNQPDDTIGTNLSVSPQDLAAQLDLIQQKGYTTITFKDLLNNKLPEKPIILSFDDGYRNFYDNAYPELKKRKMTAVSYIIVGDIDGGDYMTKAEIKEINVYGIEIGSHTLSHPDLSKLTSEKARHEIVDSKSNLETLTGTNVVSFCYPSGKFNTETEKIVSDAGYSFAVTTNGGITTFQNPLELNRYRINNGTKIGGYLK